MKPKLVLQLASVSGASAVILGAFGAHALKAKLSIDLMHAYHTAVQYQFFHTLALLAVGLLAFRQGICKSLSVSAWLFILGICLFSGSLYVMALTGMTRLGIITPLGGLSFIFAWLFFFVGVSKLTENNYEA